MTLYWKGNDPMIEDAEFVLKYFEAVSGGESFYGLYYLGEMYRQGFLVDKDPDEAYKYYFSIVYSTNPLRETDDYYWRACYRKGMDLYKVGKSYSTLKAALRDLTKAKELYDKRNPKAGPADITKEELYQNWKKLKKKVEDYLKKREELPVLAKVRCIVDDEICLTEGKVYDVLTEEHGLYGIIDDEEEDIYLYGKSYFEVVESLRLSG